MFVYVVKFKEAGLFLFTASHTMAEAEQRFLDASQQKRLLISPFDQFVGFERLRGITHKQLRDMRGDQ